MTGWPLKLWRKNMLWTRERAATELGVSLRTYKSYENAKEVKRAVGLATVTLPLIGMMPTLTMSTPRLLTLFGGADDFLDSQEIKYVYRSGSHSRD